LAPPREEAKSEGHAATPSLQHAVASPTAAEAASTAELPQTGGIAAGSEPEGAPSNGSVSRLAPLAGFSAKSAGVEKFTTQDRHPAVEAAASGDFGLHATSEQSSPARTTEASTAMHGRTLEQTLAEASGSTDGVQNEIRVQLASQGWSVQDVTVASLPDGSLSIRLSIDRDDTQSVSKRLGELRKRLEAKGLLIGELDIAGEPMPPRSAYP
jgi:hypothetical protein